MKLILRACALFTFLFTSCSQNNADLILRNGRIYTLNQSFEIASTVVIKDGKFIAVGDETLVDRYSAPRSLDLMGMPVYPGFIDAHCHFYQLGLAQEQVELRGVTSVEALVDRLQRQTQNATSDVILGRGWDQNLWKDNSFPNKAVLDAAFPDQYVVLERIDGHAAYVNSKVLNAAGITAATQIEGGEIILEEGEPSGILVDKAADLAYAILPQPTREEQITALKKAEQLAFQNGLTTVDDAGLEREQLELIDSLHQAKALKIRVYGMIANRPENLEYYLKKGIVQTDRLTIRSVKVYADGALGSRGAALKAPYSDYPRSKGLFLTSPAEIEALALQLAKKGFQMNTHAIGDAANKVVLDAYQKALGSIKDPRWRVEHAQVVDPADIEKFGPKIIPSVQPTHATSDMGWADERLGETRIQTAYTFKDLLDWSGKIALGTDFPVEKVNPILTFYAAVVRKNTAGQPTAGFQMNNALSRSEALKGMTLWGAHANFEENQKGSIEPGKVADFVLLTNDIMAVNESSILEIEVLATFLNGELVYERKR